MVMIAVSVLTAVHFHLLLVDPQGQVVLFRLLLLVLGRAHGDGRGAQR